jgi:hypothetical protein
MLFNFVLRWRIAISNLSAGGRCELNSKMDVKEGLEGLEGKGTVAAFELRSGHAEETRVEDAVRQIAGPTTGLQPRTGISNRAASQFQRSNYLSRKGSQCKRSSTLTQAAALLYLSRLKYPLFVTESVHGFPWFSSVPPHMCDSALGPLFTNSFHTLIPLLKTSLSVLTISLSKTRKPLDVKCPVWLLLRGPGSMVEALCYKLEGRRRVKLTT